MSNESLYFPHDYDSTMDNKHKAMLGEYGAVGYGLYWLIVESLHSESEHKLPLKKLTYLAFTQQAKLSCEEIETFIKKCIDDYELFVSDGEYFYADRVLRNIKKRAEIVEKKRKAGRLGGQQRMKNIEQNSSNAQANSSTCLAESTKEKKRKENEIKENISNIDNNNLDDESEMDSELFKIKKQPLSERKCAFRKAVDKYTSKYGNEMCNDFFEYFTQIDTKKPNFMLYETSDTWSTGRRLANWKRRSNTFKPPPNNNTSYPSYTRPNQFEPKIPTL